MQEEPRLSMKYLLDELNFSSPQDGGTPLSSHVESLSALRRAFRCRCEHLIFFRDCQCSSCDSALGYEPHLGRVVPLVTAAHGRARGGEEETWCIAGAHDGPVYRRCLNLTGPAGCNWLTEWNPAEGVTQRFCISCRLNRTIPNLSIPENRTLWGKIEVAKRRVISSLVLLGLPVASRTEDPERGLAFDLLSSPPSGPRIVTGHNEGLITLNIEEADDVRREQIRTAMREPYRTLVGHFRHEVGHYYWFRLTAGSEWIDGFRSLFGDERLDYAAALRKNYQEGPRPNWSRDFVSAYASVHAWEDWAETWAHYMHMVDTLATATSLGVRIDSVAMPFDPFSSDALYAAERDDSRFLSFLNSWLKLATVLNELSQSMGQPEFYPFALPRAAVSKLHFVHTLIGNVHRRAIPALESSGEHDGALRAAASEAIRLARRL